MKQRIKHHIMDFFPALRSPNYRLYFLGQGLSLVGTWFASIAQQWLIYPTLTHNQSLLGIVSAINLAPTAFLVLFAGALGDRVDKKKVVIILQVLFAIVSFIMAYLIFSGHVQIWHVMVASLITGIIFAFDMPIRQSFMVNLVTKKDFPSAISLNSAIFQAARSFGPALAGITIAFIGIAPAYFADGISFFAVIISLILMTVPKEEIKTGNKSLHEEIMEGIRYVKHHKVIRVILAELLILSIFSWPAATLMPVFAHDIFKRGEIGFGILQSSFGVGAMLCAFSFSKIFNFVQNKYRLLIVSIAALTVSYCFYALTPSFYLAMLFQFINGWFILMIVSTINTLVQLESPDHLRSRLMSFYSLTLVGGMPVGSLIASALVGFVGARFTVFYATIAMAALSLLIILPTRDTIKHDLNAIHTTKKSEDELRAGESAGHL